MLSASSKNSCDTRLPFVVESAVADFEREKRRGFKGKDGVGLERVRVVGHVDKEEEGFKGITMWCLCSSSTSSASTKTPGRK